MTKRSRPRAPRGPAPVPPSPASPPPWRTRGFWLGAGAAAVLLVPAGVAGSLLSGSDAGPRAAPAGEDPDVQGRAAELRAGFAVRDEQQVEELTERMRGLAEDLDPVVRGLVAERRADAGTVAGWRRKAQDAARPFEDVPSGETATNIARLASATAVRGILEAVRTYELAGSTPGARDVLLGRARAERRLALQAWETATVQLDVVNIAAGFGHQHVGIPGTRGTGSDGLPEGTDARP